MSGEERRSSGSSLSGAHPLTRQFLKAVYQCDLKKVIEMLEEGVPADVSNSAGLQAIHFAAKTGDLDLISEILKRGADINATSQKGNTALHVAALIGNKEVVKLLLRQGADVNAKSECNEDCFTPLYMAAQIGHQEIVTLLLAHAADPTIPTKNGSTAQDVALQQGHTAVAELLREYERRLNQIASNEYESSLDDCAVPRRSAPGTSSNLSPDVGASGTGAGSESAPSHAKPPAVYNRDVIPSPRNSPMKARAIMNVRLTNLASDSS